MTESKVMIHSFTNVLNKVSNALSRNINPPVTYREYEYLKEEALGKRGNEIEVLNRLEDKDIYYLYLKTIELLNYGFKIQKITVCFRY